MESKQPFHFKQFSLYHHQSPMSIGVDSVLLGAWCQLPEMGNLLDIGTGCGLLAMMCAQKSPALNSMGIDISKNAIEEAELNKQQNKRNEHLTFQLQDLRDFEPKAPFDFIISNPPYFNEAEHSPQSEHIERANARHQNELTISDIVLFAKTYLKENGKLSMVLTYSELSALKSLALTHFLQVERIAYIQPKVEKPFNRILITLTNSSKIVKLTEETITIRNGDNSYTEQYKTLTQEFYSKKL